MTITRTAIAASHNKTAGTFWSALCGVQVCATQTLMVVFAYDVISIVNVSWGTTALTKAVSVRNTAGVEMTLWHKLADGTSSTSAIYVSWAANVTAKAMFAIAVSGVNFLDQTVTGISGNVAVISTTGSTAATRTDNEFLFAIYGGEGISGTTTSWLQDIDTAGLFDATSGGGAATNIRIN